MEKFPTLESQKEEDIKSLFDIEDSHNDYPHSVHDATLSFEKKHKFQAYKKEKTIDQYISEEGETFFKITRQKEIQFLTSQLLGGVVQVSPIYIDEHGDYYSKMVTYKENILEAASDLFILHVIADDWDHEIPYDDEVKVRNYEKGSFFDFSHSKIALQGTERSYERNVIARKTDNFLQEIEKKVFSFAKKENINVTKEKMRDEFKNILTEKLRSLLQFISSQEALSEIYHKIDYYNKYQKDLLEPEELGVILTERINVILEQLSLD